MKDYIGQYNGYTVVKELARIKRKNGNLVRNFQCICSCGNVFTRDVTIINKGYGSCGHEKHGLHAHPLYQVWHNFIQRCYNPNNPGYANYGCRGISVCKNWQTFLPFYGWAIKFWKPGLYIDRRNFNKGYSPSNCRFVDSQTSSDNRRKKFPSHVIVTTYQRLNNIRETAIEVGCSKSWVKTVMKAYRQYGTASLIFRRKPNLKENTEERPATYP